MCCLNTVRLAVRAELVEAHSPFDRLRANELKRTALCVVSPNSTKQILVRVPRGDPTGVDFAA